jgi:hypothetical protein
MGEEVVNVGLARQRLAITAKAGIRRRWGFPGGHYAMNESKDAGWTGMRLPKVLPSQE